MLVLVNLDDQDVCVAVDEEVRSLLATFTAVNHSVD